MIHYIIKISHKYTSKRGVTGIMDSYYQSRSTGYFAVTITCTDPAEARAFDCRSESDRFIKNNFKSTAKTKYSSLKIIS